MTFLPSDPWSEPDVTEAALRAHYRAVAARLFPGKPAAAKAVSEAPRPSAAAIAPRPTGPLVDPYRPRRLIREVADRYGVTLDDVVGPDRTAKMVAIRSEAIRALREAYPDRSFHWIAQHFNRDHSTIIHALNPEKYRAKNQRNKRRRKLELESGHADA